MKPVLQFALLDNVVKASHFWGRHCFCKTICFKRYFYSQIFLLSFCIIILPEKIFFGGTVTKLWRNSRAGGLVKSVLQLTFWKCNILPAFYGSQKLFRRKFNSIFLEGIKVFFLVYPSISSWVYCTKYLV